MLGKQRLVIGVPYGHVAIEFSATKELIWALIPLGLLVLTFLSLVLLQNPVQGPISVDAAEMQSPAVTKDLFSHYADWQQTNDNYLSIPKVPR